MSTATAWTGERRLQGLTLSRDRFIVSPLYDSVFFLGSPLVAVAVVFSLASVLPAVTVESGVLVYMAIGHHVPTFLRAYGDPDEYARNRFRLLVIPALVLPLIVAAVLLDSRLLGMIFIWDQYHFVRQHYGFMRIYDAKNKSLATGRVNLDQLMCFSVFIAIIAHSDFYSFIYTGALLDLGVVFPTWIGPLVRNVSLAAAIGIGFAWVVHLLRRLSSGEPVSVLKLAITGTTYAVWYYAYVVLSNPALSYPISSFFHCFQYDALAWHYNQAKAKTLERSPGNALFRYIHSSKHVWLYIGAIGSYGLLSHFGTLVVPSLILVLNRTTAILHYYFDSFIWRVRRPEFRSLL